MFLLPALLASRVSGLLSDMFAGDSPRSAAAQTWLVRTTDPGLDDCRKAGVVAVNFFVRVDPTHLTVNDLKHFTTVATHAHQLFRFVNEIRVGSRIITKHKDEWFEGCVVGAFEYQEPATIPNHPHTLAVRWVDEPLASTEREAVERSTRHVLITVKKLDLADDPSAVRSVRTSDRVAAVKEVTVSTTADAPNGDHGLPVIAVRSTCMPVWPEVDDGPLDPCQNRARLCTPPRHTRFRHTMTLLEDAVSTGPAILYVGLNPSCPDDVKQATFGECQ